MNLYLEALINGFIPEEDENPEGNFYPEHPPRDPEEDD